jgi:soluble lytic murein transglycosylase-like protein
MLFLTLAVLVLWLWPAGPFADLPPERQAPALPPLPEVRLPYYQLPAGLTLCGAPVPLEERVVREGLDREFTIVVWSRAQTLMWLKRAHRYFPEIQEKIRSHHLPEDLKYVALVESDLRAAARSPAGAAGPWQFMAPTAQRFQLKANDSIDERLDLGVATDAALNYLKALYQQFGSWPLALAAYNAGEGRVKKELTAQGVHDYWRLALPEETERYVYRVLAAKVVLENPAYYGYEIPPGDLYPPIAADEVALSTSQAVTVRGLAEAAGTYYRAFKLLNPWIKGSTLPPGSYRLKVPKGAAPGFYEAAARGLPAAPAPAPASNQTPNSFAPARKK